MRFEMYVGQTITYYPHSSHESAIVARILASFHIDSFRETWGVWDGMTEAVRIYSVDIPDDVTAQRVAYAIAIATGNDAVLITREFRPLVVSEYAPGMREFRAGSILVTTGNRTLTESPAPVAYGIPGYSITPTPDGTRIAYLIHSDATVTPVTN